MEKYKEKRVDYQTVYDQVAQVEQVLGQMTSRESNLNQTVSILEKKLSIISSDVYDQKEKRTRALKAVIKYMKEFKKEGKHSEEQIDLNLRMMKDQVSVSLNEICRIADEHPDIGYLIYDLFQKVSFILKILQKV